MQGEALANVPSEMRLAARIDRNRAIRVIGWTMVWSGSLLLLFTGWNLYGTGLVTRAAQAEMEQGLAEAWSASVEPVVNATMPEQRQAASILPDAQFEALQAPDVVEERAGAPGDPIARLVIPAAGVDHVVVEGVGTEDLKKGPGHMPWTPMPGQPGNAVLSGHRTTYGAPFYDLDALGVGDEIVVETAIGTHVYTVREVFVVEPTGVWVTDPRPGAWLTLTTCTPRYSAAQRLIVAAELTSGPNYAAIQTLPDSAASVYDIAS